MKQIYNIKEIKDKIIINSMLSQGELYQVYSDNSFIVFTIEDVSEGFQHSKEEICINRFEKNKDDETLLKLGIITKQEYNEAVKQEEIRFEEYCNKQDENDKLRVTEIELNQLKNLKEKYENKKV